MGKGELGDYSCDLHREWTPFPHLCAAVPKLQSNLPTGGAENVRQKEIILAQLGDPDAALALQQGVQPVHFTVDTLLILGVVNPIGRASRRSGHPAGPGGFQGSWLRPFQPVDPTVDPKGVSRRDWQQSFRAQANLCLRK